MLVGKTEVVVVRGSVLEQDVDAIVNAANTSMRGGSGVDGAIHRAAGKGLLMELMDKAPHGCKTGKVVVTGGHNLPLRYIFHTPGPVYQDGTRREPELLAACYRNCMVAAASLSIASIAFPSISTGIFRYPLPEAAALALGTVARVPTDGGAHAGAGGVRYVRGAGV